MIVDFAPGRRYSTDVRKGRVVGVDPGQKRVGLAVSDEAGGSVALPFGTVERARDEREASVQVVAALGGIEIAALVVGLPLRLDGTEGTAARRARAFGTRLADALGVPVRFVDERLSTVGAQRALRELGMNERAQRGVVDQTAATMLLQSYLDRARGDEEE